MKLIRIGLLDHQIHPQGCHGRDPGLPQRSLGSSLFSFSEIGKWVDWVGLNVIIGLDDKIVFVCIWVTLSVSLSLSSFHVLCPGDWRANQLLLRLLMARGGSHFHHHRESQDEAEDGDDEEDGFRIWLEMHRFVSSVGILVLLSCC